MNSIVGPQPTDFFQCREVPLNESEAMVVASCDLSRPVVRAYELSCQLVGRPYIVHVWFVEGSDPNKLVVTLHGASRSGGAPLWVKACDQIFDSRYNLLHVSYPGYGRSSGRARQTRSYRPDQTLLLKELIKSFRTHGRRPKALVVAECWGAGVAIRALCETPTLFSRRHFFSWAYVAQIPSNLESVLRRHRMMFHIWWTVNRDHMKCCVPYKYFSDAAKTNPRIKFESVETPEQQAWLPSAGINVPEVTRTDHAVWYTPSDECVQELKKFFCVVRRTKEPRAERSEGD